MTDAEMTAFYDSAIPSSFGYYLLNRTTDISTHYKCANAVNCTSNELADLQFNSCGVTMNPLAEDLKFTPPD